MASATLFFMEANLASILTQNVSTVTVQSSATTSATRELRKDTSSEVEIADSGSTAPDNQVEIHASDQKWLTKYGIVA